MRLIITQENQTVADVPGWEGPVPRAGEYIHSPKEAQPAPGLLDGRMRVKLVSWGIIARPGEGGPGHFTGAAEPFVEVVV